MNRKESGTSPRTRGKHWMHFSGSAADRNIPAHAGKTPPPRLRKALTPEHPRARGENRRLLRLVGMPRGTSPRTRGKLSPCGSRMMCTGNIPAHAGKTPRVGGSLPGGGEHPRARGENAPGGGVPTRGWGTSPRTRGKHPRVGGPYPGVGNIPAHAGKTLTDVRFLVPEGHFTFGFIFPHHGGVKFILS